MRAGDALVLDLVVIHADVRVPEEHPADQHLVRTRELRLWARDIPAVCARAVSERRKRS